MRLCSAVLFLSAVITLTGCSAMTPGKVDEVQPVTTAPRVGNAYLLRGFIGVFSTGIDHLGDEVNASGVHGEVFQDDQWSDLADHIAQRFKGHPEAEPLVLIGHSYGADDVLRIAQKLDTANVPVTLLITLDPVTPPAVPKNVRLCVNLYQSNGVWDNLPWLRGIPLAQAPGSNGALYNANIRTERTDLLDPDVNHFNIEKKQKIHEEVLRLLLAVCPPRPEWIAARDGKLPITTPIAAAAKFHPITQTPVPSRSTMATASAGREMAN
jgi:pimeloyl-ACP methyl ester carboxylesterase